MSKVSTAGMEMEKIIRIPTVSTWRIVLILVFLLIVATEISIFGLSSQSPIFFTTGASTVILISIVMMFIPKYAHSQSSPSSITCALTILLQLILLYSTLRNSWPAILFWIMAGKFDLPLLIQSMTNVHFLPHLLLRSNSILLNW